MIKVNRKTGIVCIIVIVLFMYAFKMFKEHFDSNSSILDKKDGLLAKIRNKENATCKKLDSATEEVDKDKINSMVKEILLRQVPSSRE